MRVYMRSSVGPSVRRSVGPSVRWCVVRRGEASTGAMGSGVTNRVVEETIVPVQARVRHPNNFALPCPAPTHYPNFYS